MAVDKIGYKSSNVYSVGQTKGSAAGGEFWLCLTTAIADSVRLWGTAAGAQCLRVSERLFIVNVFSVSVGT